MSADLKPSVDELTGRALGASSLVIAESREMSPGVRVAALGAAAREIADARDRHVRRPEHMSDALWQASCPAPVVPGERDRLDAQLGAAWLRVHAAGQRSEANVQACVVALAGRLGWRPAVMHGEWRATDPWMLCQVAARVVVEQIQGKCRRCAGTGLCSVLRGGRRVARSAEHLGKFRAMSCTTCGGHGLALPVVGERAAALGLPVAEYHAQGWAREFDRASALLAGAAARMQRALRRQAYHGVVMRPGYGASSR
jgi:hypothetical protein